MWRMTHILLVDDGSESCRRTMFLLHLAGLRVTCSPNIIEALNRVTSYQSVGEEFNLLLVNTVLDENDRTQLNAACNTANFPQILLIDQKCESDEYKQIGSHWICRPELAIQAAVQLSRETEQSKRTIHH